MKKQPDMMIGESLALAEALDHLSRLASIDRPVLVMGERGTGKELAAERLHFLSSRWDAPFLKVNCAAMAESLLESELFGHEAGAFTGATRLHVGRFERADGGTLLLDEIGTTSPRLQEKLLRVVEYGEFERLGGQRTLNADVRVLGATNADLRAMADKGEFRADLLDRLSFDVVHMPALRQRDDDIVLLAEHFAIGMCGELEWELFPGFTDTALAQLRAHTWPGNVRELKNAVERSLHRWDDAHNPIDTLVIDPFESPWAQTDALIRYPLAGKPDDAAEIQSDVEDKYTPIAFREQVDKFEADLLRRALRDTGGNQKRCAQKLALSYDQLRGLVRKHGIRTHRRRRV